MKKLTEDDIEKKRKYHQKRMKYYENKKKEIEKKKRRIGFIYYD